MKRKLSSYDIAREVGVSQTTVSFVLNGRMDMPVSPATRERVLQAAREMGYRPNRSARAVQSGKFGCVALLGSTITPRSILPTSLRDGILDALGEHNLHLLMARLPDTTLTDENFVPSILREWAADGLLVNYNADVPKAMEDLLQENRLPSIWVNACRDADCVFPDDKAAAKSATERMAGFGHTRISFVQYTNVTHYSALDRENGYRDAMTALGLIPEVISPASGIIRLDEAENLLRKPAGQRPSAFLCYAPEAAATLMYGAARCGLLVPRDLSLMTFHEQTYAATGQPIDTMTLPEYEMGRVSVELLLQKIADPALPLPPRPLTCAYGKGETLSPPLT
jgi:LacI family transcriptional regulator